MRKRILGLALLGLILFLSGGIIYTLATPRLLEVSPTAQATDIPGSSPLRLTFSRPMQAATVSQRLVIDPIQRGQFAWQGNTLIFTPDQPWPSGEIVRVQLKPGARAAGLLSLPVRQDRSWTFTIGRPLLAYLYPSEGLADLYTIDPLSGDSRKITDIPGEVLSFSIPREGGEIYFSVGNGEGGSAIYRWERDTRASTQIFDCQPAQCSALNISADGGTLAYERTLPEGTDQEKAPHVWLLALPVHTGSGGGTPAQLTPRLVGDPTHQTEEPIWSPTGLLAYYDSNLSGFVIFNPKNGEATQFSSQTGLPGSWDSTGEYYVYPEIIVNPIQSPQAQANLQPIPSSHLKRYHRTDRKQDDLTGADNLDDTAPVYSADGKRLAFARRYLDLAHWTPGRQLWVMGSDGTGARPLTDEPFYNHYDFAWSPAGDELAYVRSNQNILTEPPEIWLIGAGGIMNRKLITGGYAPQWIP